MEEEEAGTPQTQNAIRVRISSSPPGGEVAIVYGQPTYEESISKAGNETRRTERWERAESHKGRSIRPSNPPGRGGPGGMGERRRMATRGESTHGDRIVDKKTRTHMPKSKPLGYIRNVR